MDAAIISSNSLGYKLLLEQRKKNPRENVFFSPLSISVTLSMLYAGTKGNTKKQMEEVLDAKDDDRQIHEQFRAIFKSLRSEKDDSIFNIVNLLAADASYDVLPDFAEGLKSNYSVDVKKYNFRSESERALLEINKLVEEATRSKIKDLFPPDSIEANTRLVLANAVYFKGTWNLSFDRHATFKKPFYAINNEQAVDTMFRKDDYNHSFLEELNASFLEIPYSGKKYSMVIILPKEKNGLPGLENNISLESINKGIRTMGTKEVSLHLPRFKLEENLPLKDLLIQLGMVDAFDRTADLSGIGGRKDLYVSAALHKAFVEVNEEGTEAAAATGLAVSFCCYVPPLHFVVDHPFMFLIRETTTGLILFIGSVYNIS